MIVQTAAPKRWTKFLARQSVARLSSLLRVFDTGQLSEGLRILVYHRVAEDKGDPFAVSPASFSEQMEALSVTGAVVTLSEGLQALGRIEKDHSMIAITFDDGTVDFQSTALPILNRLRLPATVYVSPSNVGLSGFLSWSDLQAIVRSGIDVGSHGLDHRSLGRLDLNEAREQVVKSREILENHIGACVSSIAYPYGTKRDFNSNVKEIIREAGYSNACTAINGVNESGSDLFELRRTKIEQGDGSIFTKILRGHLDGWEFVDRNFSGLQNRYRISPCKDFKPRMRVCVGSFLCSHGSC